MLLFLSSCGGNKKQQAMPTPVFKTAKAEKKDITLPQKYSATIRGRQDIEVYPQVGGTLQKLCVSEGNKGSDTIHHRPSSLSGCPEHGRGFSESC